VLWSFVESYFRPHIQSWNPATGCGAAPNEMNYHGTSEDWNILLERNGKEWHQRNYTKNLFLEW
jgi:hypothetical protein